jgi:hypothetical protein
MVRRMYDSCMGLWWAVVVLVRKNSHNERLRAVLVKERRQSFSRFPLQLTT